MVCTLQPDCSIGEIIMVSSFWLESIKMEKIWNAHLVHPAAALSWRITEVEGGGGIAINQAEGRRTREENG